MNEYYTLELQLSNVGMLDVGMLSLTLRGGAAHVHTQPTLRHPALTVETMQSGL